VPRLIGVAWPERVEIREVGPRDGLQNEAPVPIDDRVRLIDALSRTGLRRIEAVSFVRAEAIPPMAGADEVMARIDRNPDVVYSALVPNPKGAELAVAAKADEIELVVSASETHNRKNVRRSTGESLVAARDVVDVAHGAGVPAEAIVSTAFGCPYEGDVAPERVAQVAGYLVDAGADRLSFGDTTGMATPRRVDDLLDALTHAGIDPTGVGLHFHDTRGTALANVLAGLGRGGSAAARTHPGRRETPSPRTSCTCSRTWASTRVSTSMHSSSARDWHSRSSDASSPARCCTPVPGRASTGRRDRRRPRTRTHRARRTGQSREGSREARAAR
jgi:hydroxymethylglutaryl-CoA lyase